MADVVTDREGGYVALRPLRAGQLVTRGGAISPPLKVRRDRELRRHGMELVLAINVWAGIFEWAALLYALWCASR